MRRATTARKFADGTDVPVSKTRADLEDMLARHGATFMAHVVMPDGRTVADHIRPRIAGAYAEGKMVPLLPPPEK